MQKTESDTYGSDWVKRGTVIHSLGIMIAPEIFTVPEDVLLKDGSTVLEGTRYFSWPTACNMVDEHKTPSGWRMIHLKEGEFLRDRYGRSGFGLLVLGLDGYVNPSDMVAYTHMPENDKFVRVRSEQGYYWMDEFKKPVYPYVISVRGTQIRADESVYWSYGLPMLLVRDL